MGRIDTYRDGDGEWPVIEWRVYFRDDLYCSCKGHDPANVPEEGVQAIAWFIEKDGSVYCHIKSGIAADPSLYWFGDRSLIGTLIPDEEFFALEERVMTEAVQRVAELRKRA